MKSVCATKTSTFFKTNMSVLPFLVILASVSVLSTFSFTAYTSTMSSEDGFFAAILILFAFLGLCLAAEWEHWESYNRVRRAPIDAKEKGVVGYKIFDRDWVCLGMQYNVGERVSRKRLPCLCFTGYHFCLNAADCLKFRSTKASIGNTFAQVEGVGDTEFDGEKAATNALKIVKELSRKEFLQLCKETQVKLPHFRDTLDSDLLTFSNGVMVNWRGRELLQRG